MATNGIKHRVFDMKGTKKEDIPIATMKAILRLVLDQKYHPLLIHCNHGKVGHLPITLVQDWELTPMDSIEPAASSPWSARSRVGTSPPSSMSTSRTHSPKFESVT